MANAWAVGTTMRPRSKKKVQIGGSGCSVGSAGPLVTVVVADHNTIVAAVYRALAAHKVQVRSLMAA